LSGGERRHTLAAEQAPGSILRRRVARQRPAPAELAQRDPAPSLGVLLGERTQRRPDLIRISLRRFCQLLLAQWIRSQNKSASIVCASGGASRIPRSPSGLPLLLWQVAVRFSFNHIHNLHRTAIPRLPRRRSPLAQPWPGSPISPKLSPAPIRPRRACTARAARTTVTATVIRSAPFTALIEAESVRVAAGRVGAPKRSATVIRGTPMWRKLIAGGIL